MIDRRWTKTLRDAWMHKARTALVVFAVATGLIGAGAVLDTWALVKRTTVETFGASHPVSATLHVEGAGIDAALLARVRAVPGIAAVRARRVLSASSTANGTHANVELFALADFENPGIGRLARVHGTWPPREGEVAIEASSLALSGAALDGDIAVAANHQPAAVLRMTGIARDVGLPPGWMDHVVYAFVTPATLARLGVPATLDEVQFVAADPSSNRESVRHLAAQAKAAIEASGRRVVRVDVPIPGRHPHAAQMDSLLMTQGAFGLLTLLAASFLIVNLITAMLAGQAREIAVMKAIGARPAQIAAMVFAYAAGVGALASALALPVALALARPYATMQTDMLNFPLAGRGVPWWAIALQLAVGCVLPVAAAAIPVLRVCAVPVGVALRDPGIATGNGLHVARRLRIPFVDRPLRLAIGNAFRKRQRLVLTLLALSVGGAVFLGADDLRRGVRGSVELLFASQHYDLAVALAQPHPAKDIQRVAAAVDGVAHVQAFARARGVVVHADGLQGDAFGVIALPPASPMVAPHVLMGRWLDASDRDAIVINRTLQADEPGLQPGASVTLMLDGKPATWRIAGVVDASIEKEAFMPLASLQALRGNADASVLVASTARRDAAAQLDTVLRLRDAFERAGMPVAGSQRVDDARVAIDDHLAMVVRFLGAMAWVMIAIGGMGLASTMGLSVLERTREIGVLRAIGAPHRAITTMILVEGLAIAALGWLVSLPLSMPMAIVLSDAFGRIMLPVPTQVLPSLGAASGWLAMIVVVSVLACALPARRALRVPAAVALAYE